MIGAGVGWRLYKHPPITALLVGTGMALLMRTPGHSAQSERRAYRDPYNEMQPRGYVPGGVAGYGYPVEEDAPGTSTTEQIIARASHMGEATRDAAERTKSRVTHAAEDAADTMGRLAHSVRNNPLLLGLISLATGTAVARAIGHPGPETVSCTTARTCSGVALAAWPHRSATPQATWSRASAACGDCRIGHRRGRGRDADPDS